MTDITPKKRVCKAAWMKWFVISLYQRCNPEGSGAAGEHLFQQPSLWGYVNTPLLSKRTQRYITPQHRCRTAVQCRKSHSFAGKKCSEPRNELKTLPSRTASARFTFAPFQIPPTLRSISSPLVCLQCSSLRRRSRMYWRDCDCVVCVPWIFKR